MHFEFRFYGHEKKTKCNHDYQFGNLAKDAEVYLSDHASLCMERAKSARLLSQLSIFVNSVGVCSTD